MVIGPLLAAGACAFVIMGAAAIAAPVAATALVRNLRRAPGFPTGVVVFKVLFSMNPPRWDSEKIAG
jgi:hypothetical protein